MTWHKPRMKASPRKVRSASPHVEYDFIREMYRHPTVESYIASLGPPYYHGTPHEFKKFDKCKIGTTTDKGDVGTAFYFTINRKQAACYGSNLLEIYLDLEKTYRIDKQYLEESNRVRKALMQNEDNIPPNSVVSDLLSIVQQYDPYFILDITPRHGNTINVYDLVRKVGHDKFAASMQAAGYDSIYWLGEIAVFDPARIHTKQELIDLYNETMAR